MPLAEPMTKARIRPLRSRKWGIPFARYDTCFCTMESGDTYHLQYTNESPPVITLSDSHGSQLAHIQLQNGFKSWLNSECSVIDSTTGAELARFTNSIYTSIGAQGIITDPIRSSFRLFRKVSTSRRFKATQGVLQYSPVSLEIYDERETTPVILACYTLYVALNV